MSFKHPFGDYAPIAAIVAILVGILAGIRAPLRVWIFLLVCTGLYFLIRRQLRRLGPRIDKKREKEENRIHKLMNQAYHACIRASEDGAKDQKTWQKPANADICNALFEPDVPDLPEQFKVLQAAWKAGERDTELALHLMYTSWYLWEQVYDEFTRTLDDRALIVGFQEPYGYLGGHESDNCTLLLTAAHMILLFDYKTGLSLSDAEACLHRFFKICPDGIPISEFAQRGDFGDYFTQILTTGLKLHAYESKGTPIKS